MAETSAIEWCDATVNFWWGCTKVSPAEYLLCNEPANGHTFKRCRLNGPEVDVLAAVVRSNTFIELRNGSEG